MVLHEPDRLPPNNRGSDAPARTQAPPYPTRQAQAETPPESKASFREILKRMKQAALLSGHTDNTLYAQLCVRVYMAALSQVLTLLELARR
jgi:hypothetical protein